MRRSKTLDPVENWKGLVVARLCIVIVEVVRSLKVSVAERCSGILDCQCLQSKVDLRPCCFLTKPLLESQFSLL